jgi:hypothetical protein
MKKVALIAGFLLVTSIILAQTISFTFTTITDNGPFSPKHVLAVWVEDGNGNFVKSLKVMANKRIQYLYSWNARSGGNKVDAITGATLGSHQTHTLSWNCTNLSENIVPDGDYKLVVEFTDQHAQGPKYSIPFTKGSSSVHLTAPNQTNFKDMVVDYSAPVSVGQQVLDEQLQIFPNPAHGAFTLSMPADPGAVIHLRILDITGKEVSKQELKAGEGNSWKIDVSSFRKGLYFLSISAQNQNFARRLIIE